MATILVTGGTGTLGHQVVSRLAVRRHRIRILNHQTIPDLSEHVDMVNGNLVSGSGLREAVAGVHAIIHCAASYQNAQQVDVEGTRLLLQAAHANGSPHFIYPSIVGVDQSKYDYYQAKHATEGLIEQGLLPWTIARATQFHDYVLWLIKSFGADTLPEVSVPKDVRFQSIDVGEVADRLILLMEQGPSGYTPDIGGPQVFTIEEMTEAYLRIKGTRTTIRSETFTGDLFNVFKSGVNLVPAYAVGMITWEAFLHYHYSQKNVQ